MRRRTLLTSAALLMASPGCTSTDDPISPSPGRGDHTRHLQSLLDDSKKSGRPVRLERGATYRVSGQLRVTGCVIEGNGATVVCVGTSREPSGWLTGSGTIHLSDLVLVGQQSNSGTGILLEQTAGHRIRIERLTVRGFDAAGIRIIANPDWSAGGATWEVSDSSVTGCGTGLSARNTVGGSLRSSRTSDNRLNGALIHAGSAVRVVGHRAVGNGSHGFLIMYASDINVRGGKFSRNRRGGLTVGGGDPEFPVATSISLVDNRCDNNARNGISIDVTRQGAHGIPLPTYSEIRGNTCVANGTHGINITSSSHVLVHLNKCTGNSRSGIGVASSNVRVTSNQVRRNRDYGIAFFGGPSRPRYGDHVASGNDASANGRGAYLSSAEATID